LDNIYLLSDFIYWTSR